MDQERILAELLRRLRVRAGLSQEKLGSAAGVNARTISDLERSVTHYPRAGTAYRIADALGLAGAERENWLALATPVHAAATDAPDVAVTGDFTATVLAAAVRELREQRGLSARELGQRAGLSLRTITDIEAGKRQRIHLQNAARLADELRLAGHARERFLRLAEGPTAAEPVHPEEPEEPEEPEAARPAGLVGLFGRERELAEVTELLRRSPLVVLTGPGGVGKTTLAEAVLAGLDRPQLTLDLTRVPAGEELARAIAVIARFDEDTAAGWVGQLGALLPPDAVLLLDNLEHLRAVPEAVAAIRAAHPGLTVLATSRTLSGLDDGIEYAIGPLPVRAACQVFLDVAGRSGRPLPARVTSALIEEVCVRLDRLPLTIILAAAWSRLMTPQEILARLGPPDAILRAVAKPGQGPPERHATVTSTVGWSLALVSEPARALFRALSAYPAPWPLGLVEAVSPAARLDPLHELVEAGLVSAADNDAGGTSYTMLQTVRDVGHRELSDDPGRYGDVLERHAAYLLERAGVLGPELFTAGRLTALVECDQLAPHVQAAFEYLIRSADERAVSLAAAWWRYFFHRGQYRRGLAIVSRALEVRPAAGQAPGRDRAAALYGAAALASYAGEHRQATRYAEDAQARASALGDSYLAGSVISLIGMMEFYAGRNEVALGWFQHGLAEVDGESEPQTYATLLTNAAPVYAVLGDIAAARATAEDAARRCQALDNLAGVAANLGNLAEWAARVGDRDRARELLGECRELQKSLGDSYNVVQCLLSLGKLAADEGDAATAREELDAARQELEGTENPWCDAYCDALAAQIEALNGNMSGALTYAQLAVRKGEPLGYQPAIATAALADAAAAAWSGNQPRTLESAALGLRQSDQAGEAAVVSLALLVAAVRMDGISPALVGEDVLALERLIRQWASVPGCAPYPIAVHSARRRGLRLPPDRPGTSARHQVPPIGELRELALALCGPGPAGRAGR